MCPFGAGSDAAWFCWKGRSSAHQILPQDPNVNTRPPPHIPVPPITSVANTTPPPIHTHTPTGAGRGAARAPGRVEGSAAGS